MMQCLEMCISWKFRENAGNRLEERVYWYVVLVWNLALAGSLAFWVYLRFFYKFRVFKDGRFMDKRLEVQKKNS
jgi:hypothetical protein